MTNRFGAWISSVLAWFWETKIGAWLQKTKAWGWLAAQRSRLSERWKAAKVKRTEAVPRPVVDKMPPPATPGPPKETWTIGERLQKNWKAILLVIAVICLVVIAYAEIKRINDCHAGLVTRLAAPALEQLDETFSPKATIMVTIDRANARDCPAAGECMCPSTTEGCPPLLTYSKGTELNIGKQNVPDYITGEASWCQLDTEQWVSCKYLKEME